jgi:hydrogenase maturation protease
LQSAICNLPSALIGLGNPLRGDDGIGPRVIEELNRIELPAGVTALDGGTGGLDLLNALEGWARVIIVDAADVGREAGQFVRFAADQVRLAQADDPLSLHQAGLAEVLALAGALERQLPPTVVFGVQPERIGWAQGLSRPVEDALPALLEAILREVDNA